MDLKNAKTLCLVMIVRNEEKVIERCLNRVKDHIDYWVIVDTGSDDKTPDLIQKTLSDIPGELHHRPWVNFGVNRSESLRFAKGKADYLLLCDADEQIIFSDKFDSSELTEEAYSIGHVGEETYFVPYLLRGDVNWGYVGVTHEFLASDHIFSKKKLHTLSILDLQDGGFKHDKFERDIKLLEQGLIDEPNNSRYKYYLANSYYNVKNYEKAIEWYKKRIEDGGWIEEVTMAYENLGICYDELGKKEEALHYWLEAYDYNPNRLESLYCAVRLLRLNGKQRLGYHLGKIAKEIPYPSEDILRVRPQLYTYWIYYELSILAYYGNDSKLGYDCCKHVLLEDPNNDAIVDTTIKNLHFYKEQAKQDKDYNVNLIIKVISEYIRRYPNCDKGHQEILEYLTRLVNKR